MFSIEKKSGRPPGKRVKRGRLQFSEEELTRQAGPDTSGQVGPKPTGTGKFKQDEERIKPSSRLRQDDEARRDADQEKQATPKDKKDKQAKRTERAETKAEKSAEKLDAAKEKLARQKPKKPPSVPKRAVRAAATTTEKAAAYVIRFVRRHKVGAIIILLVFCLFLLVNSIFSALPSLGTGMMNAVVGTSYTAEDEDILEANEDYTALEDELRQKVANIESSHPGYDEYRYNVDELGHNPYELTSYLIAKLRTYTRVDVQGELQSLFEAQYELTLTEEVEIRYRTETRTGTTTSTDSETGETTTEEYEYEVEVPYEYYILHVRLENKTLPVVVNSRLDAEQKEIYDITLELKGNKPYLWDDIYMGGGGRYDPGSDYTGPYHGGGKVPGLSLCVGRLQPFHFLRLFRFRLLGVLQLRRTQPAPHHGNRHFQPMRLCIPRRRKARGCNLFYRDL